MVKCQACSHFCKISPGRVGVCGIRKNVDGKLYLLTYSLAVAKNIDPIEKKPLFHFLPGSRAYSFGTLGCNLRCANCQNYDISQMHNLKGQVEKYDRFHWGHPLPPEEIVKEALENGCRSIAYTYTEPTIFLEYALVTMRLAEENNLKNVWVSNGFMSEKTLDLIVPYLDAINIDIKSIDDKFYKSNCGASVKPILANCKKLVKAKVWLEVTTLMIPTLTDAEDLFKKIAEFIRYELGDFVPWHITAFSGEISWKLKHLPYTSYAVLEKGYNIGKKAGLKYVYLGNTDQAEKESTYCPVCKKIMIRRFGYQVERLDENGKCHYCGKIMAGVFK
jgi:pyruvate formate lyase activating enzyme